MEFKLKKYRITLLKSIAILLLVLLFSGVSKIVAERIESNSKIVQADIVLKGAETLSDKRFTEAAIKNGIKGKEYKSTVDSKSVMSSITSVTVRPVL